MYFEPLSRMNAVQETLNILVSIPLVPYDAVILFRHCSQALQRY